MDSRLLTACRLLMEVAAEQLTVDSEQLAEEEKRQSMEEPLMVYGDNPNFDPARFAALRRGQNEAVVRPAVEGAAPPPLSAETARPPFAAPPTTAENGLPYASPYVSNVNGAAYAVSYAALSDRPRESPPMAPDGPTATLTMRDISDHFERDARRY